MTLLYFIFCCLIFGGKHISKHFISDLIILWLFNDKLHILYKHVTKDVNSYILACIVNVAGKCCCDENLCKIKLILAGAVGDPAETSPSDEPQLKVRRFYFVF